MIKVDINILFTVINLLLLFFVIWKFLFKPVKKIIAKRQEEVQSRYDEADKAKAEAEETRQKLEEKIKATEEEKAQILKEMRINYLPMMVGFLKTSFLRTIAMFLLILKPKAIGWKATDKKITGNTPWKPVQTA